MRADSRISARAGKLVPFIGAGVSVAAGLPTWTGLLGALADEAGLAESGGLATLEKMDARDAANALQLKLGSGLDTYLRKRFGQRGPSSLTHALIASLPIAEAATTHYDRLFEQAWEAACGAAPTMLPTDDASQAARWLLKLHGSVDDKIARSCSRVRSTSASSRPVAPSPASSRPCC